MVDLKRFEPVDGVCACGKTHRGGTRAIQLTRDLQTLADACKDALAGGHLALVASQEYLPAADSAADILERNGYRVTRVTYPDHAERTQESAADLIGLADDVRLLVALGESCVFDLTKYAAHVRGCDWIAVPASPFDFDYLLPVCVLGNGAKRVSYTAHSPLHAILVEPWLQNAAPIAVAAGYGSLVARGADLVEYRMRAAYDPQSACEALWERDYRLWETCLQQVENAQDKPVTLACALAQIGLHAQGGLWGQTACDVLGDLIECVCDQAVPHGIHRMLSATAQTVIGYIRLAQQPSLRVPCDWTQACVRLARACGGDSSEYIVLAAAQTMDAQRMHVLSEYRADFAAWWTALRDGLRERCKTFRRLFPDAGYWMSTYLPYEKLWQLTQDAGAICPAYSLLRLQGAL